MKFEEFELEISKVRERFGDKFFTSTILDLIFQSVKQISTQDFKSICEKFLKYSDKPPLCADFEREADRLVGLASYWKTEPDTKNYSVNSLSRCRFCDREGLVCLLDKHKNSYVFKCICSAKILCKGNYPDFSINMLNECWILYGER